MPTRFVNFKNVEYDLGNGNMLTIDPIPYWDNHPNDHLIEMGVEKYIVETNGTLSKNNISNETLNNFDNFLSNYLEALRRLT